MCIYMWNGTEVFSVSFQPTAKTIWIPFRFVWVQKYFGKEWDIICANLNDDYLLENHASEEHEMLSTRNSRMLMMSLSGVLVTEIWVFFHKVFSATQNQICVSMISFCEEFEWDFVNEGVWIPDSKWKLGQQWVLSCNFRWANVGCAMQNHPHFAHPKNVGPTCCTNVGPTCCTNVGPICCTNVGPTCRINVGPTCWANVGPTCCINVGPTCWANVGSLLTSVSC